MKSLWTACAASAAAFALVAPAAATEPLVVHATIWPNLAITVSPQSFPHGTVVFRIKNRDAKPHVFAINGVESPKIRSHKTVAVTVTFKKRSLYAFSLPDYQPTPDTGWKTVGGQVKVT